jgi:glutathione peroxidase
VGALACGPLVDHAHRSLQGAPLPRCSFAGKVLLVVNTASHCGHTGQYAGLEALYRQYRQKGFVVLGIPTNDFGGQEPGSDFEVAEFCERTYKVTFPMLGKATTQGREALPLFRQLAAATGSPPRWNFHKYLVACDGKRAFAFESAVTPQADVLRERLEILLRESPP